MNKLRNSFIFLLVFLYTYINVASAIKESNILLPVWNHPTKVAKGAPAPQATACTNLGQIAVTYNDGPSDATVKILNGLKAAHAKANFFVNSTWLYTQQYAMILQRAYNDGHFIGMTYRAPGDNSKGLTDVEIRKDVTKTAKTIESVIGVAPKYVRLHYSESEDIRLENIIRGMGYTLVSYNLDTLDYKYKNSPETISDIYREAFAKQIDTYDSKGSFISIQYDIPETGSSQAIFDMIKTISDAGYTMVRIDGCLNDKKPYKLTANSKKFAHDKYSFGQTNYKAGQVVPEKSDGFTVQAIDHSQASKDTLSNKDLETLRKATGTGNNAYMLGWSNLAFALIALFCTWAF
ncbi:MAG: hypothetical protein EXX96DRAFT_549166 [Benjaminiella poitrasii]|nr:MAG: hypothetical protein EXX96DRAFT_549166 [Benjaminiella poitrasii]